MHFKLDENLPGELARMLREFGHDVDTVVDEGLLGSPDESVADAARRANRIVITLDTDLGDVRKFPPKDTAGVVLLRLDDQQIPHVVDVVRRLLSRYEAEIRSGRLLVVTESRVRIREE